MCSQENGPDFHTFHVAASLVPRHMLFLVARRTALLRTTDMGTRLCGSKVTALDGQKTDTVKAQNGCLALIQIPTSHTLPVMA